MSDDKCSSWRCRQERHCSLRVWLPAHERRFWVPTPVCLVMTCKILSDLLALSLLRKAVCDVFHPFVSLRCWAKIHENTRIRGHTENQCEYAYSTKYGAWLPLSLLKLGQLSHECGTPCRGDFAVGISTSIRALSP